MSSTIAETEWILQSGNADYAQEDPNNIVDPDGNNLVDPDGNQIIDTGLVQTLIAETTWESNDAS